MDTRANFHAQNTRICNGSPKGQYRGKATAVRTFEANPWGLYDMHGDVSEWCWDWYVPGYGQGNPASPPNSGRVRRGDDGAGLCVPRRELVHSCSGPAFRKRAGGIPAGRCFWLGFRLVRTCVE